MAKRKAIIEEMEMLDEQGMEETGEDWGDEIEETGEDWGDDWGDEIEEETKEAGKDQDEEPAIGVLELDDCKEKIEEESTETQAIEDKQKEFLQELNLSEFVEVSVKNHRGNRTKVGALRVINSKDGKRFEVGKEPMEKIGDPEAITIALSENKLVISAALPNSDNSFNVKARRTIYSEELINTITEKFNLDYSGRVSITFDKVEYKLSGGNVVAVITME